MAGGELGVAPKRPVLWYHGGKWRLAPWVIANLPPHDVYVEPFGGAGSVLMCKLPAREEVYNDIDGDIVNVFRVLRDPVKAAELQRLLCLTPYAREEFEAAYAFDDCDDVERARRTIVRSFMSQGSGGATRDNKNGWRSTRGESNWPVRDWQTYADAIPAFVDRLAGVTIENHPAIDVIARYDGPDALIYGDPPYMPETRTPDGQATYRYEMSQKDHAELASALNRVRGMVVLSGYDSPLYREQFKDWQMVQRKSRATNHAERVECLWISPAASARMAQRSLFEEAGA